MPVIIVPFFLDNSVYMKLKVIGSIISGTPGGFASQLKIYDLTTLMNSTRYNWKELKLECLIWLNV